MATALRNFEPPNRWVDEDGRLTERAHGLLRDLYAFVGANVGRLPVDSIGGDGVTTTTFLREDGAFATPDYPEGATPSATVGLSAVNGLSADFMRADAAPALSQSIVPTWTGLHTFNAGVATTSLTASTTIRSTGGFGCNGATPQTSAALDASIAGSAGGAYTGTEQALINSLLSQVNKLRAALVANGIGV